MDEPEPVRRIPRPPRIPVPVPEPAPEPAAVPFREIHGHAATAEVRQPRSEFL